MADGFARYGLAISPYRSVASAAQKAGSTPACFTRAAKRSATRAAATDAPIFASDFAIAPAIYGDVSVTTNGASRRRTLF